MVFEDIRRVDEHPERDFNDESELRVGPEADVFPIARSEGANSHLHTAARIMPKPAVRKKPAARTR